MYLTHPLHLKPHSIRLFDIKNGFVGFVGLLQITSPNRFSVVGVFNSYYMYVLNGILIVVLLDSDVYLVVYNFKVIRYMYCM